MMSESERAAWKAEVTHLRDENETLKQLAPVDYDLPLECRCVSCGQRHTVWTTSEAYEAWTKWGVFIQEAMPFLSANDREWLLSGICPHCFDAAG